MSRAAKRFTFTKPSQLTIPLYLPKRDPEPSLSGLKQEILEYGGILEPLIVRKATETEFLVLGGRRRLQAVWELQDDGHEDLVRHLPCHIVDSTSQLMDLKIFLLLNSHNPLSAGEIERVLAMIEKSNPPKARKAGR